jgi:hypothetical protein
MIKIVRDHATRVKYPESGEMALRWAAAGMLAAEAQFRRAKGFWELPRSPSRSGGRWDCPRERESRYHSSISFSLGGPHRSSTTSGTSSEGGWPDYLLFFLQAQAIGERL